MIRITPKTTPIFLFLLISFISFTIRSQILTYGVSWNHCFVSYHTPVSLSYQGVVTYYEHDSPIDTRNYCIDTWDYSHKYRSLLVSSDHLRPQLNLLDLVHKDHRCRFPHLCSCIVGKSRHYKYLELSVLFLVGRSRHYKYLELSVLFLVSTIQEKTPNCPQPQQEQLWLILSASYQFLFIVEIVYYLFSVPRTMGVLHSELAPHLLPHILFPISLLPCW